MTKMPELRHSPPVGYHGLTVASPVYEEFWDALL